MKTRFAPSPTGFLHIGGLRTALFAYLVAKQSGGTFFVRVEDTDRERFVEGAIEQMLRTLAWAGIAPEEGVVLQGDGWMQKGTHGPYIQSERLEIYREHVQKLLDSGHAYYAFDTKDEIEQMRNEEQARGNPAPKYDSSVRMRMRNSLTLSAEEVQSLLDADTEYVIRFKTPEHRTITFEDDIRGKVQFASHEVDDQVLMKSDGFPTYHLAHVVDDHLMQTDIVIRGEEWLPSLPKHILLFEAFEFPLPRFAHVPLLLNHDRTKLSKRQSSVSVDEYREKGYLPEAILNFVALLGWNPGSTQEIFTLTELVDAFSLERIQKAGAVFDADKLDWLQGQWVRTLPVEQFAERILPLVAEAYPAASDDATFVARAGLIHDRITVLSEAPEMLSYFYEEPQVSVELLASPKQKVTEGMLPEILDVLIAKLEAHSDWANEPLKDMLFALADEKEWKKGQLLWPLRAALTGKPFSPGAYEVAAALGKEETIKRLQAARSRI